MAHLDRLPSDTKSLTPMSAVVQKNILRRVVRDYDPKKLLTEHSDTVHSVMHDIREGYIRAVKHGMVTEK